MGLKNRTTKKGGPSRRLKKRFKMESLEDEFERHDSLKKVFAKIMDSKGHSSQNRFAQIFGGAFEKPSWFVGIRKATIHEDHNEGTDFFVITRNYGEIRFDVKSSFYHYQEQVRVQNKMKIFVWCIVVKSHLSDEEIRKAVFLKCSVHISRLKREVRLGHFHKRTT